jgi:predicted ester cyclase
MCAVSTCSCADSAITVPLEQVALIGEQKETKATKQIVGTTLFSLLSSVQNREMNDLTELTKFATRYALPDMIVTMDKVLREPRGTVFHWTLTGTNTGPGGAGKRVRISGYELWKINNDGLIGESKGHFDSAEYERQLKG